MSQYSIELYFDPSLENQVLKSWNVLARRQISTHLIEIESRPHITLFSSPFIDPLRLEHALKSFSAKQDPLPITFFAIGSYPSEKNVLFLVPKPSVQLLQFQERLCDVLRKESGVELGEEYRVGGSGGGAGGWAPWCAVGEEVSKGRMGEGFCVLREVVKLPVSGYGVDIGLVELEGPDSTVREQSIPSRGTSSGYFSSSQTKRQAEVHWTEDDVNGLAMTSSLNHSTKHVKLDGSFPSQAISPGCLSCTLEFDGAAKGNPGPAGAGDILHSEDGSVVFRLREGVGRATNNAATYRALILGLNYALKKGYQQFRVRDDSMLVCLQEFNSEADEQANIAISLKDGEIEVDCVGKKHKFLSILKMV